MKNKWMLVAGLGLAMLSVVLVNVYLSASQQSFTLLQFTKALKKGEEITSSGALATIPVPENFGSVLKEAVRAEDQAWVVGKRLVHDAARWRFRAVLPSCRPT